MSGYLRALTDCGSWQVLTANKCSKSMLAFLTLCSFLIPRIYKTIHRPPYEMAKTEDLSGSFLSLQEIQSAYCKFKQLFLIGEKDDEPTLLQVQAGCTLGWWAGAGSWPPESLTSSVRLQAEGQAATVIKLPSTSPWFAGMVTQPPSFSLLPQRARFLHGEHLALKFSQVLNHGVSTGSH